MMNQITHFSDAFNAWEQWNLAEFDYRSQHLQAFQIALGSQDENLGKLVDFHLTAATKLLKTKHQLTGPTGETNELYTSGRGVTLMIFENLEAFKNTEVDAKCLLFSAFAMLTAALIAGNSIMVCSDNIKINNMLNQGLVKTHFPPNLIQISAFDDVFDLLDNDISTLGFIGNDEVLHKLNLQLAKRDNPIASLVFEENLKEPILAHDPLLALRFITERTKTINITAIGGNASLLGLADSYCSP